MRTFMFAIEFRILLAGLLIITAIACGRANDPKSPSDARTPSPTPNVISSNNSLSSTPTTSSATSEREGEYKGYHYFYTREGDRTVALFAKRFLPRDDTIVVGAIRHVIRKVFKEETYGEPYLQNTTAGGTAVRAIRVDGTKHGYVVVPVKEDSGEINSLTITQVSLK